MHSLRVKGMHGLGDNIHQRAVIRHLMRDRTVWLETPWPQVYHDLAGERLRLVRPPDTKLRTQTKNAARQDIGYAQGPVDGSAAPHTVWYHQEAIRRTGTILAAMCENSRVPVGDFRMPVPLAWQAKADAFLACVKPGAPLMIYRPLVDRTEWDGCGARNPDPAAYARLAKEAARGRFVISVADVAPGKEWIVSPPIGADVECHAGELDVETIAALMARGSVVFCSPGFALIMAQAVGARLIAVFGGYEQGRFYDHGALTDLLINPARPCECFSKRHRCDKTIDLPSAEQRIRSFLDDHHAQPSVDQAFAA